jgi:predicted DNA-binding protein (MmcQ/YjbR family)
MNIEQYREYCLSKPGTTEHTPFGPDTLVFKVMNKMFALSGIETFDFINLKCDPEYAIELREKYDGTITPGYHMNKKLWNSVYVNVDVPDDLVYQLIDDSYQLIVDSLPKKVKEELNNL